MRYYVQDIAMNYCRNLCDQFSAHTVHPANLNGIDEADMLAGYRALVCLFGQLYHDIEADPASFSMLLRESLLPDAKDAAYTLSNQSLVRVPHLLFSFGAWGTLDQDGALCIRGNALKEAIQTLKITKAASLLDRLSAYDLAFAGAAKAFKPEDTITLTAPANPFLPAALHAAARAMLSINKGNPKRGKDLFCALHPGLLECAPGKAPVLSLEDMCRTIPPDRAEIARRFDQAVAPYVKRKVTMSGIMRNDWGCVYTLTSNKRILLTLNTSQQALHVKMNLAHLNGYAWLLDQCGDSLRDTMLSAWECGRCNGGCAGGFQFTYRDAAYNKCRGGAFQVPDILSEQVEDCLGFLEQEVQASA